MTESSEIPPGPILTNDSDLTNNSQSPSINPTTKRKHRSKLWESFLSKTRRIRIRKGKGSQLEQRASSQPNIPSADINPDAEHFRTTFPVVNGKNKNHNDRKGIRDRDDSKDRKPRPFNSTSSFSSYHDSAGNVPALYGEAPGERWSTAGSASGLPFRTLSDPHLTPEVKVKSGYQGVAFQDDTHHKDDERGSSLDGYEDAEEGIPVIETTEEHTNLLQPRSAGNSFFMLNIHLKEGRDLVIRDSCGTSDPYVKFKYGGKHVYKSRTILKNLNPRWDEQFSIPVDDVNKPVNVKVFDYDRAWNDDPMGGADIDLSTLEPDKETELKLILSERGKSEYMGYLILTCSLMVKSEDDKDQFFRRSVRAMESGKKLKMQPWSGIVTIVLVEGSNLMPMDDNGLSDPYVKFRLGTEKYRSKFKLKTLNPKWLEKFDLRLYDEQLSHLEVTVYDHDTRGKDDFMGRAVIDISQLEREKTHVIEQMLEDGAGVIKLLLTITGTSAGETPSDLSCYTPSARNKELLIKKYGLFNSFTDMSDVGHLQVKVFRAHGLQAADFGGFSDPFCVLELVNDRVQTQTEYKTLNPEWAKVFTFQVKDIHSILEVTIYDEDKNKKVEFLGKVAVPLLRIRNGERRWYALKDRKLVHKTKGAVLLEMDFVFNQIKAAVRTVNPREEKFMMPDQKFKIAIMKQNINRLTHLLGVFMDTGRFIQSCFDWQSAPRSITAFIVYLVIVWNFEIYMLPISLLLLFMKNLLVAQIVGGFRREPVEDEYHEEEDDDEDEEKDKQKKTEEKKTIMERYHAIQEVCLQVQQGIDTVACLGERVKNTFNWSVPWLSTLAVLALIGAMIVLFYIPLRFLLLAWGINKFTKKLRKPNAISNNELLDFLSRIPSDDELHQYRELRPDIPANTSLTKKKRS